MKNRKMKKINRKHLEAARQRAGKRTLKEEDFELLGNLLDNLGSLKGAVEDDVDEKTLERMLRDMFGDKA